MKKRPPLMFGEIDPAVEGATVCMVCRACPAERCICGACAKPKRKPKKRKPK